GRPQRPYSVYSKSNGIIRNGVCQTPAQSAKKRWHCPGACAIIMLYFYALNGAKGAQLFS
ncbi:hypothetical protein, partial [Allofournierella sp.]|uniref:hypothetical protein n=1 Tax=Allofournierella sp. TaxID=1940256 RepID=UPI003AB13278